MQSNQRVVVAALILSAGVGGALWFRRPASISGPDSASRRGANAETPIASSGPPATPQLLGRIDPVDPHVEGAVDLRPNSNDPEMQADRGKIANQLPTEPPWNSGDDHGSIAARMASNRIEGLASDSPNSAPAAPPRTHKIGDGDTLAKLARRYLGSEDRRLEIYDANREVLTSPDVLPIGVELKIPDLHVPTFEPGPMVEISADELRAARERASSATN